MFRGSAFACLLAGTILAAPALAQATAQPAAPQAAGAAAMGMDQGTTQGAAGQGAMGQAGRGEARAIAQPQPGQMLGSDLRGTRVYGASNESIGDISDLVVDRDGRLAAVIVGVGGFLGIGQKDVAVPFEALEIVADMGAANSAAGAPGIAPGTAAGQGGMGGTAGVDPTTTGTVGAATGNAATNTRTGTVNPNRIVLRGMTRQNLEEAPAFRADASMNRTGTGAAGGAGTTAPRQ
jgi:sporulation protein YlmC with PRC-barrel domain